MAHIWYYFVVVALDEKLQVEFSSAGELFQRIKGHIIAYGYVVGLYRR